MKSFVPASLKGLSGIEPLMSQVAISMPFRLESLPVLDFLGTSGVGPSKIIRPPKNKGVVAFSNQWGEPSIPRPSASNSELTILTGRSIPSWPM